MFLLNGEGVNTAPIAVSKPVIASKTKHDRRHHLAWVEAHLAGLQKTGQKVRVSYTFDVSDGGIRRFRPHLEVPIDCN